MLNFDSPLPPDVREHRIERIIDEYIAAYQLNLAGLTVLTEAGTNAYAYTSIIAAKAGAETVHAMVRGGSWGSADHIESNLLDKVAARSLQGKIYAHRERDPKIVASCDIVTNSGAVRPIDAELTAMMKPTCVVPLMWETWEVRPDEVDLEACKAKGVLVMGTDETTIGFHLYPGFVVWKLMNDCRLEGYNNRVFIISSIRVGRAHRMMMQRNGVHFRWTSFDAVPDPEFIDSYIPPAEKKAMLEYLSTADALVLDERFHDRMVVGDRGVFTPRELRQANPGIVVINRSGGMDYEEAKAQGLFLHPDKPTIHGVPSVGSYYLGDRPVLDLNTAGLKVGEAMARARLAGLSLSQSAEQAMQTGPAMDFNGEFAWVQKQSERSRHVR